MMIMMPWRALLFVLSHYVILLTDRACMVAATLSGEEKTDDELSLQLLEWLRANGAFISSKVEVRNVIPGDPTSPRGVFALDALEEGEVICRIPWNLIIKPEEDPKKEDWDCGTVEATVKAMSGDSITPYGKYLLKQPRGYLPAFWSTEGQTLLSEMLGEDLPPHNIPEDTIDWAEYCKGASLDDPLQMHARMIVLARADYQLLVPFYDMINHRNGKWYNVRHTKSYEDLYEHNQPHPHHFEVVAGKMIQPGEQLYNSYNQCNICAWSKDWLGTPEMLKQYGFVELMPQRWLFHYVRVKFDLDWKDGDESSGELEVKFLVPPSERGMAFFRKELKRLQDFAQRKKVDAVETLVPKSEWATIWQYHNALTVAMTHALKSAVEVTDEVWKRGRYWWVEEGEEPPEDADEVYNYDEADEEFGSEAFQEL